MSLVNGLQIAEIEESAALVVLILGTYTGKNWNWQPFSREKVLLWQSRC